MTPLIAGQSSAQSAETVSPSVQLSVELHTFVRERLRNVDPFELPDPRHDLLIVDFVTFVFQTFLDSEPL